MKISSPGCSEAFFQAVDSPVEVCSLFSEILVWELEAEGWEKWTVVLLFAGVRFRVYSDVFSSRAQLEQPHHSQLKEHSACLKFPF